jgi:hypothetical protein
MCEKIDTTGLEWDRLVQGNIIWSGEDEMEMKGKGKCDERI